MGFHSADAVDIMDFINNASNLQTFDSKIMDGVQSQSTPTFDVDDNETEITSEESFDHDFDDTETDCDFLSHSDNDDDADDVFGGSLKLKPTKNKAKSVTPTASKSKSMRQINKKLKKCDKQRAQSQSVYFLKMPIHESDDDDNALPHNLGIPQLHNRAFSESAVIQKQIQENQWPSTASSDESFDAESVGDSNHV